MSSLDPYDRATPPAANVNSTPKTFNDRPSSSSTGHEKNGCAPTEYRNAASPAAVTRYSERSVRPLNEYATCRRKANGNILRVISVSLVSSTTLESLSSMTANSVSRANPCRGISYSLEFQAYRPSGTLPSKGKQTPAR